MTPSTATLILRVTNTARIMVATFGMAGIFAMCRKPHLWTLTDGNGDTNWLAFVVIACLAATLIELAQMPIEK